MKENEVFGVESDRVRIVPVVDLEMLDTIIIYTFIIQKKTGESHNNRFPSFTSTRSGEKLRFQCEIPAQPGGQASERPPST